MKKTLIAVAAAAALATSSAFAEITFGAWMKGIIVPIANDGGDSKDFRAGHAQSWGDSPRPAAFSAYGVSEDGNAGFQGDIFFDGANIGTGDYAMAWLKPVDMLKLSFGKFDGSATGLREGSGNFGEWDFLRVSATNTNGILHGDNGIFDGTEGRNGLMAELTPVEGLKALVLIPYGVSGVNWSWDVYKKTMVNVAYSIDGIGTLKAGWWGENEVAENGDDTYLGRIGVAFDLTAVENLYVGIGAKFDIADKDSFGDKSTALVAVNASYKATDELTVNLAGGVNIFKNDDYDPQFSVAGGVSYQIMDGLTALADVRFLSAKTDDEDPTVSFLVGLNKAVSSNGSLGIGFQGATNGAEFAEFKPGKKDDGSVNDGFLWAVPVVYTLWF